MAVPELQSRILTQADRGRSKYENVLQHMPVLVITEGRRSIYEYSAVDVLGVLGRRFHTREMPRDGGLLLEICENEISVARRAVQQSLDK